MRAVSPQSRVELGTVSPQPGGVLRTVSAQPSRERSAWRGTPQGVRAQSRVTTALMPSPEDCSGVSRTTHLSYSALNS
eukprot:2730274-Rhodomonas_salina.1